jgi:hypothetical protein
MFDIEPNGIRAVYHKAIGDGFNISHEG